MANASIPAAHPSSIDPAEAAHFGRLAAEWWDPKGSSAMLHRLNPVRLRYIRDRVDAHWGGDAEGFSPLAGRRALDVGCGAGLLAEPFARLGGNVTALDAAPESIAIARVHAEGQGLSIDYRAAGVETLGDERFDLVTAMEVIEHVVDPAAFTRALARVLSPGGLLIVSTPNRTALSRLAMISLAEGAGRIPRGTHDWNKFIAPEEMTVLLTSAGLTVTDTTGIAFSPSRGLHLSDNLTLNYVMTARFA